MTLTVRLDAGTESALERYCTERGVTKSLVVQESLALYLVDKAAARGASAGGELVGDNVSDNYKAFEKAGLIGAVALGTGADKAAVRARIADSFARRKARGSGA